MITRLGLLAENGLELVPTKLSLLSDYKLEYKRLVHMLGGEEAFTCFQLTLSTWMRSLPSDLEWKLAALSTTAAGMMRLDAIRKAMLAGRTPNLEGLPKPPSDWRPPAPPPPPAVRYDRP